MFENNYMMTKEFIRNLRVYLVLPAVLFVFVSCEKESIRTLPPKLEIESLFAINGNNSVTLGWTPPMYGVIASIEVYRGKKADLIPSSFTLFTTISPGETRFTDTTI